MSDLAIQFLASLCVVAYIVASFITQLCWIGVCSFDRLTLLGLHLKGFVLEGTTEQKPVQAARKDDAVKQTSCWELSYVDVLSLHTINITPLVFYKLTLLISVQ